VRSDGQNRPPVRTEPTVSRLVRKEVPAVFETTGNFIPGMERVASRLTAMPKPVLVLTVLAKLMPLRLYPIPNQIKRGLWKDPRNSVMEKLWRCQFNIEFLYLLLRNRHKFSIINAFQTNI
jgi:hypothetical protein